MSNQRTSRQRGVDKGFWHTVALHIFDSLNSVWISVNYVVAFLGSCPQKGVDPVDRTAPGTQEPVSPALPLAPGDAAHITGALFASIFYL